MNPRIAKELRLLALPAGLAALAALLLPLRLVSGLREAGEYDTAPFFTALGQWMPIFFILGFALLAAMPFGVEFQHRTMPLLLGQPEARARLWRDKMLLMATVAIGLLVLMALAMVGGGHFWGTHSKAELVPEVTLYIALAAGVICASGWWTLVARSTIGGVVFNLTVMFLIGGIASVILEAVLGPVYDEQGLVRHPNRWVIMTTTYAVVGAIYAGVGLGLGWWKFARLEVRENLGSEEIATAQKLPGSRLFAGVLRCRPTGGTRNLFRKELRLHRAGLLITGIVTLCWLLTHVVMRGQPTSANYCQAIFAVLTVVNLVLLTTLTGSVAFGEEKSLGLAAWHRTLPISTRQQWLVKFLVAGGLIVCLGLILPFLLAVLSSTPSKLVGLVSVLCGPDNGRSSYGVLVAVGVVFVLSFWAGSFTTNVIRATLTSLAAMGLILPLVILATWGAEHLGGLQTGLITYLVAYAHLPSHYFSERPGALAAYCVFLGIAVSVMLVQSYRHFRATRTGMITGVRSSLILAAVVFFGSFWSADWARSISRQSMSYQRWIPMDYVSPLSVELAQAVDSYMKTNSLPYNQPRSVSMTELVQTGKLSRLGRVWLKKSQVRINFVKTPPLGHAKQVAEYLTVDVTFSNGRIQYFSLPAPAQSPPP